MSKDKHWHLENRGSNNSWAPIAPTGYFLKHEGPRSEPQAGEESMHRTQGLVWLTRTVWKAHPRWVWNALAPISKAPVTSEAGKRVWLETRPFLSSIKVTWSFRRGEVILVIPDPFDWGYYAYHFVAEFVKINLSSVPAGRECAEMNRPWVRPLPCYQAQPLWMLPEKVIMKDYQRTLP